MSKSIISDDTLTAIANAIREKTGDSLEMTPAEMADAIAEIPTGGGAEEPYEELTFSGMGDVSVRRLHGFTKIPAHFLRSSAGTRIEYVNCNIVSVGDYAFESSLIQSFTGLEGIKTVGTRAFYGCYQLVGPLPAGITSIGESAFNGCTRINDTSLPAGITSIGKSAFYGCTALALTSLPAGITSIMDSTFYNCTALALTSLPAGITDIGTSAFYRCSSLALTSLPDSITNIRSSAFYNCPGVALTSLPSSLTKIAGDVFHGTGIQTISIHAGITSIDASAFAYCDSMTDVTILGGTNIGNTAFQKCTALAQVKIVGRPSSIATSAFSNDTALTDIYVSWSEGAVTGAPWGATNATIHYDTTFDSDGNIVTGA